MNNLRAIIDLFTLSFYNHNNNILRVCGNIQPERKEIMKLQFCKECGSELNEKGVCPNRDCASNQNPQSKDTEVKAEKKVHNAAKDAKKVADKAANNAKQRYEAYANSMKASIEKEKGKLIVPDCVAADENETPIKQYDIARLQSVFKGAFAEGRLQVTNKRVLFRANGISISGPTTMQSEFSIEEIGGIEIRKEPRFNLVTTLGLCLIFYVIYSIIHPIATELYDNKALGSVLTVILAVAAGAVFYFLRGKRLPRYAALCVLVAAMPIGRYFRTNTIQDLMILVTGIIFAISFLYNAFARNLVVRVMTKGASSAAEIRRKDGFFSFQHNEYTGFSQVIPGPDVDLAIQELGSIIRAIQHGQLS